MMPRCNLTLKQKVQLIELSSRMPTDELAKKFHVHPSTVTRTLRKRNRIQEHATRVNNNFKTVQTNLRCEEHDAKILEYLKAKQQADEPATIKEICDKAVEFAKELDRDIKSRRGWWRRFKVRCNIIKTKLSGVVKRKPVGKNSADNRDKDYTFNIKDNRSQNRSGRKITSPKISQLEIGSAS